MRIAIDGTAASGKGTLSENLSKELIQILIFKDIKIMLL